MVNGIDKANLAGSTGSVSIASASATKHPMGMVTCPRLLLLKNPVPLSFSLMRNAVTPSIPLQMTKAFNQEILQTNDSF